MTVEDARSLLDRIGVLGHRSDLDLLIFFARHPRSLLTSETLVAFLGYEPKDIAESLEVLMSAVLLQRSQTETHAARMYVFAAAGPHREWFPSLLRMASSREGRLALREALGPRSPRGTHHAQIPSPEPRAPSPRSHVVPLKTRLA